MDRLALLPVEDDAPFFFYMLDVFVDSSGGRRGAPMVGQARDIPRYPLLRVIQGLEINPVVIAKDDLGLDQGFKAGRNGGGIHVQKTDALFHERFEGHVDVTVIGLGLQDIPDAGLDPGGVSGIDSQVHGDLVGGLETDAPDVRGQAVRVLRDLPDGLVTVSLVDFNRVGHADVMTDQKLHDLLDVLLFLPARSDYVDGLPRDALDFGQPVRRLFDDREGVFAEVIDDHRGFGRPESLDEPRTQVLAYAVRGSGLDRLGIYDLELLAVLLVGYPVTGDFDAFAGRYFRKFARYGQQSVPRGCAGKVLGGSAGVRFGAHSRDRVAGLLALVGDAFDGTGENVHA